MSKDNKYTDEQVYIRDASAEDMVDVAEMIQELADYEEMPDGPKLSVADLQRDGFESNPPAFLCKVAVLKSPPQGRSAVAGYVLYFPTYSTWNGRSLLMEDLYVRQSERGRGIGGRLFCAVAQAAVHKGCGRVDFHVLQWNTARRIYDHLGASNLTGSEQWLLYRLTGEALVKCAKRHTSVA